MKERKKYSNNKSKVFIVVMDQCNLAMHNSLSNFHSLNDANTVIGLLSKIKDLTFTTTSAQHNSHQICDGGGALHPVQQ